MLMVHGPGKYTMLVDNIGLKDQRCCVYSRYSADQNCFLFILWTDFCFRSPKLECPHSVVHDKC